MTSASHAAAPRLHLIFARAANGVIGRNGTLPWHLPADLAHFKRKTLGQTVIMGRKTWDSLPERFRPLPGRRNIVVTRQPQWSAEGAERAGSLEQALALCTGETDAWVIGGADLYAQALPLASSAEVTELHADFDGDAFAPAFGAHWQEVAREAHSTDDGLRYSFVQWRNSLLY